MKMKSSFVALASAAVAMSSAQTVPGVLYDFKNQSTLPVVLTTIKSSPLKYGFTLDVDGLAGTDLGTQKAIAGTAFGIHRYLTSDKSMAAFLGLAIYCEDKEKPRFAAAGYLSYRF